MWTQFLHIRFTSVPCTMSDDNDKVKILRIFLSTVSKPVENPKEYPVFLDVDINDPTYAPYDANADGTTRFRLVITRGQQPTPALSGISVLHDKLCDKITKETEIREYTMSAEDSKLFWERLGSEEERGKRLKPRVVPAKLDPERRKNYQKYYREISNDIASKVKAWKRAKSTVDSNSSFQYRQVW